MQESELSNKWERGNGGAYLKDYPDESIYLEMPLVRIASRMIEMAAEGIPITKTGNPKLQVLKEWYPLGPKDWYIERHPEKQIRMDTCSTLAMIWDLFHDVGLFRKYKDTVRLSRKGKAVLGHPRRIAHHLLIALQTEADTAILDGYDFDGFNDSLESVGEMLYSFGEEFQPASFYAEKYATADPAFDYYYNLPYEGMRASLIKCFEIRVMVRFFNWFGLVEEQKSYFDKDKQVVIPARYRTTPLFKKLIAIDSQESKVTYPLYYLKSKYVN